MDLRLATVALGMYLAEWVVLRRQGAHPGWLVAGLLACGFAAGILLARGGRPLVRSGLRGATLLLLGSGLGAAVAFGAAENGRPAQLLQLAGERAVVSGSFRLASDPRAMPALRPGDSPAWSARGQLSAVVARGRAVPGSVKVLARGRQLADLEYAEVARVVGRLAPGRIGSPEVATLSVLSVAEVGAPGRVQRAAAKVRLAFRAAASRLSADRAGLLVGLAVGDESLLPDDLVEAMRETGLAHLTAVSGSNTSLVVLLTIGLATRLGLRWQARIGLGGLALAGYVCLVRPQPSVLRAAVMGAIALVALARGGRRGGLGALAGAVIFLLAVLPELAQSIGFGLSVAATAGLLTGSARISAWIEGRSLGRWLPRPVVVAIAVSGAAQLATLPMTAALGNGISVVALPANLLAAPVVPYITVVGLAGALLAVPLPTAAGVAASLAGPAAGYLAWVARRSARLPNVAWPGGLGGGLAMVALMASGLVIARLLSGRRWLHRPRGPQWLAIGVLVTAAAAALRWAPRWVPNGWPPTGWVLVSCDVGQGDATVLRVDSAGETALLVDTGPEPSDVRRCLRDLGVRRLAAVFLTHFHADHIDGLSGVLRSAEVGEVFTTPIRDPPQGAAQVDRQLADKGVRNHPLQAGQQLIVGSIGISVLWPASLPSESIPNNSSLVLDVALGEPAANTRVLLTGDVEQQAQSALMMGPAVGAQVVKVPHHGSALQRSGFPVWAGARVALISVGADNDYGHPALRTMAEYESFGAAVKRTDQHGDIAVVITAGGELTLISRR